MLASIMSEKRSEDLANFLAGAFFLVLEILAARPSPSESEMSNSSLLESMAKTSGSELSEDSILVLAPLTEDFLGLDLASDSWAPRFFPGFESKKSDPEPSELSS